jgi:UDP-N-acetylmuramoylalanine--D-glutamate ligase
MAGLKSIEGNLVVIAGGVEKGLPLEQWTHLLAHKKAKVVVIGEIKERMKAELQLAGVLEVQDASSMEDAVDKALALAQTPASIVLSPACSSFDMFKSYAHRGEVFAEAARKLA